MELEGQKGPVAGAAPLVCRAAHHHQHRLQLRPATRLIAAGLSRQSLCSVIECCRRAAAQLLTVLQSDLELDPDGQRMTSQLLVCERCW